MSITDKFMELHNMGKSTNEIAHICNCGISAVRRWKRANNLNKTKRFINITDRNVNEETVKLLLDMGYSKSSIAVLTGVGVGTITRIIRTNGWISMVGKNNTSAKQRAILEMKELECEFAKIECGNDTLYCDKKFLETLLTIE